MDRYGTVRCNCGLTRDKVNGSGEKAAGISQCMLSGLNDWVCTPSNLLIESSSATISCLLEILVSDVIISNRVVGKDCVELGIFSNVVQLCWPMQLGIAVINIFDSGINFRISVVLSIEDLDLELEAIQTLNRVFVI